MRPPREQTPELLPLWTCGFFLGGQGRLRWIEAPLAAGESWRVGISHTMGAPLIGLVELMASSPALGARLATSPGKKLAAPACRKAGLDLGRCAMGEGGEGLLGGQRFDDRFAWPGNGGEGGVHAGYALGPCTVRVAIGSIDKW